MGTTNGSLTAEQIRHYEEHGSLHGLDCFDTPESVAWLRTKFEALLALMPPGVHVRDLGNWNIRNNWVYELASDPRLLDALESLIGPDFFCWGVGVFYKEPHKDQVIRWHQGTGIWPLSSSVGAKLEGMSSQDGAPVGRLPTVMIAVSQLTKANGCLRFLNDTHLGPTIPHQLETNADRDKYIFETHVPEDSMDCTSGLVHAEMKAGQFSIHHGATFHSSGPNTTDGIRCGLAIRYATYDLVFDPVRWPQVFAQPMRGTDRYHNKLKIAAPPTKFEIPTMADLPHLDAGLSRMARAKLKARRAVRKIVGRSA
ncbi:MAG: non-heme Fe2+,alpha-ketoglutarate-dependent halogenase [Planctomycetota bacterium]|jgi:non-heme Fe2+,alpha-ketoglutarate-dependent halogenase